MRALVLTADSEVKKLVAKAVDGIPVTVFLETEKLRPAIEAMEATRIELLILDSFLPGSSGLEFLKTIRDADDSLLIVVLARLQTRNPIDQLFRHGANDILPYPCQADTLRQTLLHRLTLAGALEDDLAANPAPPSDGAG